MQLTNKQEQGLKVAVSRYKAKGKYTVIAGYAGSGKSTLVRFIIDALNINEEDVCYCAYTGKAAQVLINKGCKNAVTAHKLLYDARPLPNGKFYLKKKDFLDYKVIVCDECSMLPAPMVELLLSYPNIYVIFCGDNAQLPPIRKEENNHLLDKPHIFLDEIVRQAQDSGIIRLSMLAREGRSFSLFKSDDVKIISKKELVTGHLDWADQILCATNKTRNQINTMCRTSRGYTNIIEENEKLICCTNYWDTISDKGNALTNGCIGILTNIYCQNFWFPSYLNIENNNIPIISGNFITNEEDNFGTLDCDQHFLLTGGSFLTPKQKYRLGQIKKYQNSIPYELTYSYCITTWKAQGSEFDKVLGIVESFPFGAVERRQYLYTLITRATKKLVLVREE